jgi:hypothetical protein
MVFNIPCDPVVLTTTVTTGVIANAYAPDIGDTPMFSSRFAAIFQYYLILKITLDVIPIAVSTGVAVCYWGKDSGVPTANSASETYPSQLISLNSSIEQGFRTEWVPTDIEHLEWISTGDSVDPTGYYKTYTSAAAYGSTIVATPVLVIKPTLTVAFRDYHEN